MFSRYKQNNSIIINNSALYTDLIIQKGITELTQNRFFSFKKLQNINLDNFEFINHIYTESDRLYNISNKYYGSPEYGWLILYLNKLSNELILTEGYPLRIYFPKEYFIDLLRG
jgi:hypothetical protein